MLSNLLKFVLHISIVIICLFYLKPTYLFSSPTIDSILLSGLESDFDIPGDEELTGEEKQFIEENDVPQPVSDEKYDIFSQKKAFISFNFGSQGFRERVGTSVGLHDGSFEYPLKINYGKWDLEIQDEASYFYDLKAKNIGTSIGASYYFIKIFPVFVNLSLGYSFWKGDITPHITDSEIFKENFNSKFDLQTLSISVNLGWSYFFKNGFFIQHCIYGIGTGLIVHSSFSNSLSSKITSVSKDKIKHPYGWGLVNIGVGKLF